MGLFKSLFGGGDPEAKKAREEARKARDAERIEGFRRIAMGEDPDKSHKSARMRGAMDLVLFEAYPAGREAWLAIGREFPDELGECLTQAGACAHLMGEPQAALDYYQEALKNGADPDALSDNIKEARKAVANAG